MYYRKAADHGFAIPHSNPGSAYYDGEGVYHTTPNQPTHNSNNTQHTRVIKNTIILKKKVTKPNRKCYGEHMTPNST
jgi:hypothetical protein